MRFLADESCDFRVVRALRNAGHDVTAVIEVTPLRERRIFLTEDRDFGQLVYAAATSTVGVILLRFPAAARANLPALVVDIVARHGEKLSQRFVVLPPGRIRFGRSATSGGV